MVTLSRIKGRLHARHDLRNIKHLQEDSTMGEDTPLQDDALIQYLREAIAWLDGEDND